MKAKNASFSYAWGPWTEAFSASSAAQMGNTVPVWRWSSCARHRLS